MLYADVLTEVRFRFGEFCTCGSVLTDARFASGGGVMCEEKKTDAICIRLENGGKIQLLLKTPCAFPLHILKTFLTYLG